MAKYDLEMLLADIKSTLTNHLNTKIAEINTEKGDNIVLKTVNESAYCLQSLNGALGNYDPLLWYGGDDIISDPRGPNLGKKYVLSVVIILADNNGEADIANRMFRYGRVLEELFERHWNSGRSGVKFEIKSLVPTPLPNLNSSETHRAVGVTLEGTLA